MKKALTLTTLVALTAATFALSGCCGSGSCPIRGKKDVCGERKGSAKCITACQTAEKCACGAVKGSAACAVACKK